MASFYDTVWYCNAGDQSTTGHYAVTKRPQNTAVAAGVLRRQFTAPTAGNERVFACIVAGTTANTTDATWTLGRGAKITDGTATWIEVTGMSAVNGDATNTPTWTQAKAIDTPAQGAIIKRNNGASYQICTTAGSLGASEPAFSDTAGVTTSDGTTVWTSLGVVGNFAGGGAPHARLNAAQATTWFTFGNTIYVADNHAESWASAVAISVNTTLLARVLCHNHSGSYPPAASDLTTGATITSTGGAINFTSQGSWYYYGITFVALNLPIIQPTAVSFANNWLYFDNCSWQSQGTGNGARFAIGGANVATWAVVIFNNTTVKFADTTGFIGLFFCKFVWQNTGLILVTGSSIPSALFNGVPFATGGYFNDARLEALDLSQLTGSLVSQANGPAIGSLIVKDCKLNASMSAPSLTNAGLDVQLIRCDSGATGYKSTRYAYEGVETTETTITRVGGAIDTSGQAQARKIVTSANAIWQRPFKAEPYAVWNPTTGANVTVTVSGTINSGTLPRNDEIWIEAEYLSVIYGFDLSTAVNTQLLNGNLMATHVGTAANSGARVATAISSGKYYFELKAVAFSSDCVGLITAAGTFTQMFSGSNANCIIYAMNGNINTTASFSGNIGGPSANDVIGIAVDFTAGLVWLRKNAGNWNGSGTANPATATGGFSFTPGLAMSPCVAFGTAGNESWVLNQGPSYANAAPSGFGNWPNGSSAAVLGKTATTTKATTLTANAAVASDSASWNGGGSGAGWSPFKLVATLSSPQPGLAGFIEARVRVGKLSATYYIDPMPVLS